MAQQNVEVRIVGKDEASPVFTRVGGALERMKISVESNRGALGKLDGALKNSATQMLGLQGSAGQISKALLAFGPAGIAAAAGLAVIGGGIALYKKDLEEAREAQERNIKSLEAYSSQATKTQYAQDLLFSDKFTADIKLYTTEISKNALELTKLNTKLEIATENQKKFVQELDESKVRAFDRGLGEVIKKVPILGAVFEKTIGMLDPLEKWDASRIQKQIDNLNTTIIDTRTEQEKLLEKEANLIKRRDDTRIAQQTEINNKLITQYNNLRAIQSASGLNAEQSKLLNETIAEINKKYKDGGNTLQMQVALLSVITDINKRNAERIDATVEAQKKYVDTLITEYGQLRQLQDAGFTLSADQGRQLSVISRQATQAFADTTKSLEERLRWSATANDVINRYIQSIQDANTKLEEFQTESRNRISADIETWAKGITDEVDKLKEVSAIDILRGIPTGGDTERDAQRRRNEQAQEEQERVNRLQLIAASAYAVADGFDVMTDAVMNGDNAFKALERGARSAIRGIMRAFAQEQIARGIGAVGSALSQTALGNFPAAGAFYKSAAKHFAAAAAAGIAGGVVGGGGSNRGGGGGFSESNLGNTGRGQSPIFITITGGGLLDMNNPETARAFTNAINVATNRRTIITRR
jgi:hypothetical protein